MTKVTGTGARKADHIRINLQEDVRSSITTGLEHFRLIHEALPDFDLQDIDLSQRLFNKPVAAPILISSMTGGTEEAKQINLNLAKAAQRAGIVMGVGSQRAAIEDQSLADTFRVREVAPDILLFANLGAVQLNYSYGIEQCMQAIEMIQADGLILHLNSLQEALQPEGQTRFANLSARISELTGELKVPVIIKEVGWGISAKTAARLVVAGVAGIDVAGAGGTSWSQVEMHRAETEAQAALAAEFIDWGLPTAESIQQVRQAAPGIPIFASGGLRTGMDIAKCIALGADLGGMAGTFLKAASESEDAVTAMIDFTRKFIQIAMFGVGASTLAELKQDRISDTRRPK
jgi:isopentenyl-diphosphate delta-isomerase